MSQLKDRSVVVRVPESLVESLDRLQAEAQARHPGWSVTRSDVVRDLLASGIAERPGGAKNMTAGVFEPA